MGLGLAFYEPSPTQHGALYAWPCISHQVLFVPGSSHNLLLGLCCMGGGGVVRVEGVMSCEVEAGE